MTGRALFDAHIGSAGLTALCERLPARPASTGGARTPFASIKDSGAGRRFLFGDSLQRPVEEAFASQAHMRDRVLAESGLLEVLARDHGVAWADLADEVKSSMLAPSAGCGPGLDIAAMLLRSVRDAWLWDRTYSRIAPSASPPGLGPLSPTDISALRASLLNDTAFADRADPQLVRIAPLPVAVYLASPHTHFIGAELAMDVATTALPDPGTIKALRLPGPWNLVFHPRVPVLCVEADDQELTSVLARPLGDDGGPGVVGGLLGAHPDGTIDPSCGFLLMTERVGDKRQLAVQWATYGSHGAGRLLYSYAAQLGFARWLSAPPAPRQEHGKPGSTNQLKRLARTPEARAGALHQVKVLSYTAPPDEVVPPHAVAAAGGTAEMTTGTTRRAYWKPGVRIGLKDPETGRFIGPVYKTGEENVTFVRERRWIRSSRTRPELPLSEDRRVYQFPHQTRSASRAIP